MGAGNVEFHHISVMLEETVKGLVTNKEGIYVDCTLGGAGHSHRIAELLSPEGRIIGIDQDEEAIEAAKERLKDVKCRVDIVHSNFSHLEEILEEQGAPLVDGVVFDLGVSSHQIDTAERGFSYMHDAPLDMRMDPEAKFSAYDVVNTYSEKELDRIFHDYGEERWGRRIAKQTLKEMARGCICPPELPVCVCHHKPEIRLLGKPKQATADELAHNSRSKSAKLRIAEKLATDDQEETRKGER